MEPPFRRFTVIEPWVFESITPSQYITFTMPNPLTHRRLLNALVLRVAVLDSPTANADDESPEIAAMIVPTNLETDWNFCSESGHFHLLFKSPTVSRLILIGNNPPPNPRIGVYKLPPATDTAEQKMLQNELKPLLLSMHPKASFNHGSPETLFLSSAHNLAYRVTVAKLLGPIVGEFLVEDIELVGDTDHKKELRRRLRFKRTPNLVQSEALVVAIIGDDEASTEIDFETLRTMVNVKFGIDTGVLSHQYLVYMVSGLFLIASHLHMLFTPKALCFGIGGGVLLTFLETQMGFEVTGVEADQMVVTAAMRYFGLNETGSVRLIVGDAIECIQNFQPKGPTDESKVYNKDAKFDAVFVDLDSSEANTRFCAPPPEFVKKHVLEGLRSLLDDHGILIMNVVALDGVFYVTLVEELKQVFHKVYGIDVGDKVNFVVMATVSPISPVEIDNGFMKKLKSVITGTYVDSIVEL